MPVYEYHCTDCDHKFETIRNMTEYKEPSICPSCGCNANRAFITAPNFSLMNPYARKAHQINERSAHEPKSTARHTCGPGCAHKTSKPQSQRDDPALKMQTGKRPWMIGH
ncbi:MAG: FmdB family zinc ribbon protein [Halothiobacillus sp.]